MIAGRYNYPAHYSGNTIKARTFTMEEEQPDGSFLPIDISSWVITGHFKLGDETVSLAEGSGISKIDAVNGVFRVEAQTLDTVGNWDFVLDFDTVVADRTYIIGQINILEKRVK